MREGRSKKAVFAGALALAIILVLLLTPLVSWLRGTRPPSIILIVLDTVRADHLSAYGYARPTSPYLEKLAAEGALFERAFSPAPWTPPSHASLFTGRLPYEHGCRWGHIYLPDEHETLAERLHRAGYATGAFSANVNISRRAGFAQGFETFVEVWHDPAFAKLEAGAGLSNAAALDWIDGLPDDKPFFLFINHMEAHLPYRPPHPFRDAFYGPEREEPKWSQTPDLLDAVLGGHAALSPELRAELTDLYDGELLYLDRKVREFCEALAERGVLDDCLLVITSDHGESLGEDGLVEHQLSIADRLLHVPLLLRWPDEIPGGLRVSEPVALVSLFETLLGAAGGRGVAVEDLVGSGSGPILAEYYPPIALERRLAAVAKRPELFAGYRAIRVTEGGRERKYVETFDGEGVGGDPGDARRLSGELRAVLAGLEPYREPEGGDRTPVPTEDADLRAMRGLGYLSATGVGRDHSFHAAEHRRRGEHLLANGELEAAVKDFRRACWLDPGELRARFGLARGLDLQHHAQALPAYRAYLRLAEGHDGEAERVAAARERVAMLEAKGD